MSAFSVYPQRPHCASRNEQSKKLHYAIPGLRSRKIGSKLKPVVYCPYLHAEDTLTNRQPVATQVFPFDQAWAPSVDAASLAPQLFATSLFPYLCFLFYLTRSGKAPRLTLFGFYFLLVFVGATIPAGIYAKLQYGTSLANVDWLHGAAESLLTITNLLIVLGLRQGIREAEASKVVAAAKEAPAVKAVEEMQQSTGGVDARRPATPPPRM